MVARKPVNPTISRIAPAPTASSRVRRFPALRHRARCASSACCQTSAMPAAAKTSGRSTGENSPAACTSSSAPTPTAPSASSCTRPEFVSSRAAVGAALCGSSSQNAAYIATPTPPAIDSATNASRTTKGDSPRCSAMPLATPPTSRAPLERTTLRCGSGGAAVVTVSGFHAQRRRGSGTDPEVRSRVRPGCARRPAGRSSWL